VGHLLFLILHVCALLFGMLALLVTIPLHLIYAVVRSKPTPSGWTHTVCPYCREYVHREASVCPHCRRELVPDSVRKAQARAARAAVRQGKRWWQP
jgi:predicted amidophosphoribosyltransferase